MILTTQKILVSVIFDDARGYSNPDAAADALRKAGYEVHRCPKDYDDKFPGLDFIEAVIGAGQIKPGDDPIEYTDRFTVEFGGDCYEWLELPESYTPFKWKKAMTKKPEKNRMTANNLPPDGR
jgi:hypothetical protein